VTAYGTEEDVRKSRDAGFSEHLLKPVELSRLHEAIQRVLALP
jgi:CheY-like chemotaxis protein